MCNLAFLSPLTPSCAIKLRPWHRLHATGHHNTIIAPPRCAISPQALAPDRCDSLPPCVPSFPAVASMPAQLSPPLRLPTNSMACSTATCEGEEKEASETGTKPQSLSYFHSFSQRTRCNKTFSVSALLPLRLKLSVQLLPQQWTPCTTSWP